MKCGIIYSLKSADFENFSQQTSHLNPEGKVNLKNKFSGNRYLYPTYHNVKRIIHILLGLLFSITALVAQTPDSSGLLQDQNPNHKRSKDKYTKPTLNPVKEVFPADTIKPVITKTTTVSIPATKPNVYIKNLKDAEERFVAKGNYKNAYEISLLLKQANDSLAKNETTQRLLQARLNFDSLQQIEQSKTYQKDILQKQAEVDSSRKIIYLVITGLVLALLLAIAFYRNYKNTQKANRIIAQQQLETEEKKRIIENSLTEKETLLKEIHHRVKNNLQIISSLLNLQANRTDDENLKKIMGEARNRISSMALIHQKIYQSGNLSSVDFQAYIEQMVQSIDTNFNNEKKDIKHEIHTNSIVLDIDTSIPLGLIINELLTNSYKYAFVNRTSGTINIDLKENNAEELELHVSDDGAGLPENFDPATLNSLGLKLVKGLANQVKGIVRFESNGGTHCFIDFKKPVTA
jgi:two-component sensor histidine kinase